MRIVDNGFVSDVTTRPADRRFAAFASLCPLESGAVLSSFQVGAAKHASDSTIGLCRSRDCGHTWEAIPFEFARRFHGVPGSFPGGELVEIQPGLLMLCTTWFDRSDPLRPLFDPVTEGILRTKQLRSFSTDEGDSWSEWEELSVGNLRVVR